MNFKKWVKSIQTAGYNGARTVLTYFEAVEKGIPFQNRDKSWRLNYKDFTKRLFFISLLPTILDYWKRASYKSSDRPISIMGLADTFGPRCLQLKVSFPFLLMLQMPSTNAKAQKCNLKRLLLIKFHSGDYAGTQGLGLLRLHSTYRHDLKIYASDEGKSWFDLRNTKIKRQVMGA